MGKSWKKCFNRNEYKMAKNNENLKEAFKNIEKQFGKGAIMRMGDNSNV